MFKESRKAAKKGRGINRRSNDGGTAASLETQSGSMLDKLDLTGNLSIEMKELKKKFTE